MASPTWLLSLLSPEYPEPTEQSLRHLFYQVQNWTWLNFCLTSQFHPLSLSHSPATHVPASIFHTSVIGSTMHPGATASLLSTPSYYSTKSSGGLADLQKQFIHIGRMDGSGGAWPLDLDLHQQIHKGTRGPSARMTDVTSRGRATRGRRGCFPAQSQVSWRCCRQQLQEEMPTAVFLIASVSHRKTNPGTLGSWRQISMGHTLEFNVLLELQAPDLKTWESKAWEVASLAQIPLSRKAPTAMTGGAAPSNPFGLLSSTKEPKQRAAKGAELCEHR